MKWHLTTAAASPLASLSALSKREKKSAISQWPPTAGVGVEMRRGSLEVCRYEDANHKLRSATGTANTTDLFLRFSLFFSSALFFLCHLALFSSLHIPNVVVPVFFFLSLFTQNEPSWRCLRRFFLSGGLRVPDIHVLVCIFSLFLQTLFHKPRIWVRRR